MSCCSEPPPADAAAPRADGCCGAAPGATPARDAACGCGEPKPAADAPPTPPAAESAKPPERRRARRARVRRQVPPEISEDPLLKSAIATLPSNYSFEVPKTIWRLRDAEAKCVALQLPEGLLIYANALADIMRDFTGARVVVLADVTYGACCVDDLTAKALGADFLARGRVLEACGSPVHYGHSCLVPTSVTGPLRSLYVFVEIAFDVDHLVGCVAAQFGRRRIGDGSAGTSAAPPSLALAGTIQFVAKQRRSQIGRDAAEIEQFETAERRAQATGVERARAALARALEGKVQVPQQLPLSAGEVLGCTSPRLDPAPDALVFVADGRFHLESIMIRNPTVPAFRYDPYGKVLTRERYDVPRLRALREDAVARASKARRVGLVLGSLGRQGSPAILGRVKKLLKARGVAHFCLVLSEISPKTLARFDAHVDAWIQVACPRLSMDWGHQFSRPCLSSYEAFVAFGAQKWDQGHYPMDYYAKTDKPWGNYYKDPA